MTASWPSNIPQCPSLPGFSEQRQQNVLNFQPDVGPPKLRRRKSYSGVKSQTSFRMSLSEVAAFNSFFIDTLQDGSASFSWRHPVDGIIYNWWFDAKSPPLIERVTNDSFRVSFPLSRFASLLPSNVGIGSARGIGDALARSAVTAASRASASGTSGGLGRTTTGLTFDSTAVTMDSITHTWDEQ